MDTPRWSDRTAGQMDGKNWLVDSKRKDRAPPTSKGHWGGRKQQHQAIITTLIALIDVRDVLIFFLL